MKNNIKKLELLSRKELGQIWLKTFKTELPNHIHKFYVVKYLIWQNENEGLTPVTEKRINKMVEKLYQSDGKSFEKLEPSKIKFTTGTKLIREFKGRKHEVIATDKGFEYKGRIYKSLSAIANEITGTRWNGKRFFGVI